MRLPLAPPQSACVGPRCPPPWRGARGHARHCIGTRRPNIHWHTPHPTPTPLRAWGAQRGDCERLRPCIAPTRDRAPPPFPGHPSSCAAVDAKLLFESQAEVRARGSHRCPLRAGTSRSRSNRTRLRAFDARRSALACIAARVQPAAQHAALQTRAGQGGHWSVPYHLAQQSICSRLARPRPQNPSARPGLMVEDCAWITSGDPPPFTLVRWSSLWRLHFHPSGISRVPSRSCEPSLKQLICSNKTCRMRQSLRRRRRPQS